MIGAGGDEAALAAAQAAADAMRGEGIALPFPGGIVRSGSKVGALTSKSMPASTNHQMAPTLRAQVPDTLVPDGVGAMFEIVIDGVSEEAVREAMRRGLHAAAARGRHARDRRQLRRQARRIPLPALGAARPAVTLTLTLRAAPAGPRLGAGPDPRAAAAGSRASEVAALTVRCGARDGGRGRAVRGVGHRR